MRERYHEITAAGADVVAVGTGDTRYAAAFVRDERIPFMVLVDDDGLAAAAASVGRSSSLGIFSPSTFRATRATWRRGFRIHRAGKRVLQLGATFVIAPDGGIRYEHLDRDTTDHAPLDAVLAALTG